MSALRRSLGLPLLLFYGIGVIVGAGIYSIIGAVVGEAGHAAWMSLLLAAIPALLVGLCYAELSVRFPSAGASYIYVREAFPRQPWAGFLAGFVFIAAAAATATTVAVAFGDYVSFLLGLPGWLFAIGLLAACTLVNVAGIRESSWMTVACTLIELAGLAVIIALGIGSGRIGERVFEADAAAVLGGAALSFFVYTGFEGLANLSEETKRPERNIPLAILVSLAVTTVLYVLVALAVVALAEPREIAGSDAPLVTAASAAAPWMKNALGWVALFAMANTALITLVVTARTVMVMAREGQLPSVLGRTSAARKSPWAAALVMGALASVFLPLGEVAVLGSVSSLLILTLFVAVCASLVLVRLRDEAPQKGFRVPWSVRGIAVVPVVGIVSVLVLAARFEPVVYAAGVGAVAVGVLAAMTRRWWSPGGGGAGSRKERARA